MRLLPEETKVRYFSEMIWPYEGVQTVGSIGKMAKGKMAKIENAITPVDFHQKTYKHLLNNCCFFR